MPCGVTRGAIPLPNQKEILLSPLGRLPTKYLDVCRRAAAFVPLGIYGLLFLLLTSHLVTTRPLLASVPGSKGIKRP